MTRSVAALVVATSAVVGACDFTGLPESRSSLVSRGDASVASDAAGALACVADGVCEPACANDPDCGGGRVDGGPDAGLDRDAAGFVDAASGSYACTASDADDGTAGAASLGTASIDCQFYSIGSNWVTAMSYCAGLGGGWRLPTKGEALKIAATNRGVCRTQFSAGWYSWTKTCAGAGLAWGVSSGGQAVRTDTRSTSSYAAICVR
jgi:hypothetical protein